MQIINAIKTGKQWENWEIIKDHLEKQVGLLITNRQVGKSTALAHILFENKNDIVLVRDMNKRESFIALYRKLFGVISDEAYIDISKRAICNLDSIIGKETKEGTRVWIDEYFLFNSIPDIYPPLKFGGAVGTALSSTTIMIFD